MKKGATQVHSLHHIKRYRRRSPTPEVLETDKRLEDPHSSQNGKSPNGETLIKDLPMREIRLWVSGMERDGVYGPGETSELKRGNGPKKSWISCHKNNGKREKKPVSSGKTQDARVDNNFYKLRLNPKETFFFGQQIFAIMQHPHERRAPTPEISFQGIFLNIISSWEIPTGWAALRPYAEDHNLVHRQPIQERPPPSLSNLLQHSFGQYPSLPEIQAEEISAEAVQHAHEMLHRYGPQHLPSPS
uniref:Uncharacterized protein n=1 Tax=Plectus sambesii TaxID=2011161 RepID=A0A914VAA9_9BILA